ncbi:MULTISPECIES: WD40 repeat domain-containing serine/threonine protein kinase [Pseudofrankia]|uniref:WD40 repeat domain-containing serine/threonine protein kinase n=1 Tax=Pseudofrankia TaxID=2994363 RepID=UPI000234CB35|nr:MULTISPECIES: serine/threonine-protein kinase [Pseudofrankia]
MAAALPGYELGAQLGQGAFGLVLAGRHQELHRDVAIKVLPAGPDGTIERGRAEARLLAALDHPHIVRVYDAVATDDLHLIVMELLAGGTLSRRRKGMAAETACAVGLAVADALGCAHRAGVLHRDIKPDNILFDAADLLKVTDFGIAKIVEGASTTASAVIGTPRYMAPEQLLGARLSPATDLYALGVLLYELLTGTSLFGPAVSGQALAHHHLHVAPAPPAGVPGPVADVVMRTLAKDPADRPQTAHAFALALAQAAAEVHGPGWTSRAGIRLRLDEDIRAATESPTAPVAVAPLAMAISPPGSGNTVVLPTQRAERPLSDGTSNSPPTRRSGRSWSRLHRHRLPLAAAAVLLAITGTVLGLTIPKDADSVIPLKTTSTLPSVRPTSRPTLSPLGSPLIGHTGDVRSVAFAPGGRTLVSSSDDGTVRLWDISKRNAPEALGAPLTEHADNVYGVAFAPDGRTIASASADNTVRLWDVSNLSAPKPLGAPLTGHTGYVYSVAFAPDGRTLASASFDTTVRLWDVSDLSAPRPLGAPLTGHTHWVFSVAFAPDGRTLASASDDGTVRLWDISDLSAPQPLGAPLTGHAGHAYSVAFAPDGRTLASASNDGTVRLWDVSDLSAPRPLGVPLIGHTSWATSVAFAPDGRTLASASDDTTVRLWDISKRSAPQPLELSITGHTSHVNAVAFAPDGRTLASASNDYTIRLWEVR